MKKSKKSRMNKNLPNLSRRKRVLASIGNAKMHNTLDPFPSVEQVPERYRHVIGAMVELYNSHPEYQISIGYVLHVYGSLPNPNGSWQTSQLSNTRYFERKVSANMWGIHRLVNTLTTQDREVAEQIRQISYDSLSLVREGVYYTTWNEIITEEEYLLLKLKG